MTKSQVPPTYRSAQLRRILGLDRPERDRDLPCPSRDFEPGTPCGTCQTDGHYMCRECAHADPDAIAERDLESEPTLDEVAGTVARLPVTLAEWAADVRARIEQPSERAETWEAGR